MRVIVTSVMPAGTRVPSDEILAAALQQVIDQCNQLLAVSFVSDCAGNGHYTISFSTFNSAGGGLMGVCAIANRSVRARVISITAPDGKVPDDDQLASALQALVDQEHQIIAVTSVCDGAGGGCYKISFLDYSQSLATEIVIAVSPIQLLGGVNV